MQLIFGGRYSVDERGNVFSHRNNASKLRKEPKLMKLKVTKQGYVEASLYIEGQRKSCLVHRLVAQAFIPNPDNKPQVNHINGVKSDNQRENLEWATASENLKHAHRTGLKKPSRGTTGMFNELHHASKKVNMLSREGEFIKQFPSLKQAGREGFTPSNIFKVCTGQRALHMGYSWEYA